MARHIGLDVHKTSTTMAVVGPSGKQLSSYVVQTNAKEIIDLLRTIPRSRHLCFEQGTQSAWLYEVLSPHVDELVVAAKSQYTSGAKHDQRDAFKLADELRTNSIKQRVYKDVGQG